MKFVLAKRTENSITPGRYFYEFMEEPVDPEYPRTFWITKFYSDDNMEYIVASEMFTIERARRCWAALMKKGYKRVR